MNYEATIEEILTNFPVSQTASNVLRELELSEQTRLNSAPGGGGGGGRSYSKSVRAWRYVTEEVYLLLCTDDPVYKEERRMLRTGGGFVISLFSGLLVSKFGLEAGLASSMVALALLVPMRIGVEAWGKAFKDGRDKKGFLAGERDALIRLADFLSKAKSADAVERRDAIYAFSTYSIPVDLAMPVLIPLLEDENDEVKFSVVRAIEDYGEQAHAAVPALLKTINDKNSALRIHVYMALWKFRPQGKLIVPALTEALKRAADPRERSSILVALGVFGRGAERAVPEIHRIIEEEESAGRGRTNPSQSERRLYEAAEYALQKIRATPSEESMT